MYYIYRLTTKTSGLWIVRVGADFLLAGLSPFLHDLSHGITDSLCSRSLLVMVFEATVAVLILDVRALALQTDDRTHETRCIHRRCSESACSPGPP